MAGLHKHVITPLLKHQVLTYMCNWPYKEHVYSPAYYFKAHASQLNQLTRSVASHQRIKCQEIK